MSEPQVDLSQIRGDWTFHMNYVANAITQTLARAVRLGKESEIGDAAINDSLDRQVALWEELKASPTDKSPIPVGDSRVQEFIELSRNTKAPCDRLEEAEGLGGSSSIYDTALEQFTEACRQVRGLCDDLEMMREQAPGS